jgi:hypothetical protein
MADLAAWRRQEEAPPAHWWWYLDVLAQLPAHLSSQETTLPEPSP